MADEPQVNTGAPAQPTEPAASQAPAAAPETASSQTVSQASPPSPAETQSEWVSVRDHAKGQGVDFGDKFTDDTALLNYLLRSHQQLQEANQFAQYGRAVLPHWSQFQQYIQQSQQQPAPAKAEEFRLWNLPEYSPAWAESVMRDEQGNLVPRPGAPPDVVSKLQSYARSLKDVQDKFWQSPESTLEPLIQRVAEAKAKEIIQQQMGGYQAQSLANQFEQQNARWLYEHDANGQPVVDPMNQGPVLSQWGKVMLRYLGEADQMGIKDVVSRQKYALGMTQRDYAVNEAKGKSTEATNQQLKAQFIQQPAVGAAHQPNLSGASRANGTATEWGSKSLGEMLRKRLTDGGM